MLRRGMIKPFESSWASLVVWIIIEVFSTRFCIDYRKLNDATHKDAYPLPSVVSQSLIRVEEGLIMSPGLAKHVNISYESLI